MGEEKGERTLPFHWDKMNTIPGRPNEFLFLLGPSNALLYSAIPARRSSILDDTFTEVCISLRQSWHRS